MGAPGVWNTFQEMSIAPRLVTITRKGSGALPRDERRFRRSSAVTRMLIWSVLTVLAPASTASPKDRISRSLLLSLLLVNPVGVRWRVETFPSAVSAKFAITSGRFVDLITLCLRWSPQRPELRPAPLQDAARQWDDKPDTRSPRLSPKKRP